MTERRIFADYEVLVYASIPIFFRRYCNASRMVTSITDPKL